MCLSLRSSRVISARVMIHQIGTDHTRPVYVETANPKAYKKSDILEVILRSLLSIRMIKCKGLRSINRCDYNKGVPDRIEMFTPGK